jgi:hypothetical protein
MGKPQHCPAKPYDRSMIAVENNEIRKENDFFQILYAHYLLAVGVDVVFYFYVLYQAVKIKKSKKPASLHADSDSCR